TAAEREQARQNGTLPLLARFIITGHDVQGRPFGRTYDRRIDLAVRTRTDEFWEIVDPLWLALGVAGLVVLVVVVVKKHRKKKRKAAAERQRQREHEHEHERADDPDAEVNYMRGVQATAHDVRPVDLSGTDRTPSSPAPAPREPAPRETS